MGCRPFSAFLNSLLYVDSMHSYFTVYINFSCLNKASNSETPKLRMKVEVHQTTPPTRACAVYQLALQRLSPKKGASDKNSQPGELSESQTTISSRVLCGAKPRSHPRNSFNVVCTLCPSKLITVTKLN